MTRTPQDGTCPDCGSEVDGPWCSRCGQRQGPLHVPLRRLVADFLEDEFSLEGRLPRTLRQLVFRPGALTLEWMAGRRSRYIAPLRLYLLTSFVMFGAVVLARIIAEKWGVQHVFDQGAASVSRIAQDAAEAQRARESAPLVLFAAVPLFARFLRDSFRTPGLLYVDYLITALHAHAFAFIVIALTFLLEPDLGAIDPVFTAIQVVLLTLIPVHLAFTLKRVFRRGWAGTLLRTVMLFSTQILIVIVALALVALRGAESPQDEVARAHALYADAMAAQEGSDTSRARITRTQAIVAYRRLEAHVMYPHVRYHLARLLLIEADTAAARLTLRHGLVDGPADPLLLGLAASIEPAADSLWHRFRSAAAAPAASDTMNLRAHAAELADMQRAASAALRQPR